MTKKDIHPKSRRRSFLRSVAAVGLGATVGTSRVTSATDSDGSLDAYHQLLQNDLTENEGLPAGEFVYGDTEADVLDAFELAGGDKGTTTQFDVSADVPFTNGVRIDINEDSANPYSYSYKGDITDQSIEEGTVLLAVAYVRGIGTASADESVEANVGFKYEYTTPDGSTGYSQSYVDATGEISPPDQWKRYYVPIEITEKPDGTNFSPYLEFWTGYGKQTIDFGGIALLDYDQSVSVSDLPTTDRNYDYPGRAEDAAWRERAYERIEEIRKTDFEVSVVDANGNHVEEAAVNVEMQEHAFDFGSEFALSQVGDRWESNVAETYRQTFLENFNKAALTNSLKASPWSGETGEAVNPENAKRAIQWLLDHDVLNRGHALVWEEYDWMNIDPSLSKDRINELVKQRIRTRASEFRGDLPEWDLHNHPIWQNNIRDDLGRDVVSEWWATGHDAAPDAQMYVNEMNIIAGNSYRDPYHEFISWLMEHDASVEGIGFMGHFSLSEILPPEELLSVFDRFAEHGVPLQITEFDVQINDRSNENEVEVQADFVRDVLTAAFSHEALEGVMSWCFWDRNGDPKRYYSADWTLRLHGEEYQRLVFDEWWTDVTGSTDSRGTFTGRGFKGDYEITVDTGTATTTVPVTFDDDSASVAVQVVDLDVKSTVNPMSQGTIPVQIEGTALSDIDVETIRFGTPETVAAGDGTAPIHVRETSGGTVTLHFPIQETGMRHSDSTAKLVGKTTDGTFVFGVDEIRTSDLGNRQK